MTKINGEFVNLAYVRRVPDVSYDANGAVNGTVLVHETVGANPWVQQTLGRSSRQSNRCKTPPGKQRWPLGNRVAIAA